MGNVEVIGDTVGTYRVLVGKPAGNRQNGKHSC